MFGNKLFATGLFLLLAARVILPGFPAAEVVGAVLMAIGVVLLWLDK